MKVWTVLRECPFVVYTNYNYSNTLCVTVYPVTFYLPSGYIHKMTNSRAASSVQDVHNTYVDGERTKQQATSGNKKTELGFEPGENDGV